MNNAEVIPMIGVAITSGFAAVGLVGLSVTALWAALDKVGNEVSHRSSPPQMPPSHNQALPKKCELS